MTVTELRKLKMTSPDKKYYEAILNGVLNLAIAEGKREPRDSDIVPVIKSLVKEGKKASDIYQKYNEVDKVAELQVEISFYESFLPKMMTEEEIKKALTMVNPCLITKGDILKALKAEYGEIVDMKIASGLIK